MLRCRRFYTTPELVKLYKSQVLSYIESRTPALHHAAPSVLDSIDRVQRRFIREVGLTEIEALEKYRLAPLPARRDMAMIGLIHRVCHSRAPAPLADLFVPRERSTDSSRAVTRGSALRHNLQLIDFINMGGHTEVLRRSCFGLVTVWNMLPVNVAQAKTTKTCQKNLQKSLLNRAKAFPDTNWQHFFSTDARVMPAYAFQRYF